MPFQNALLEIRIGNVASRIVGPAPRQQLFRRLNPHAIGGPDGSSERMLETPGRQALVYDPADDTFLTGALPQVKRLLRESGFRLRLKDLRGTPRRHFDWQVRGATLRDYQQAVVEAAIRKGRGLVDVGTGGGKTLLAAAIIARLGLPTLYVVTTRTLLFQSIRALRSLLGEEPAVIGQGAHRPGPLTVALVQSLESGRVDPSFWIDGVFIFDEGHHAVARTYLDVVRRVDPRFHYYLSAVPFRSGADQAVLDALAGAPLTGGAYSSRFLIENGYACEIEVHVERCSIQGEMHEKPFSTLYRECIVENVARNHRIAEIVREHCERGLSVLVLVEHVHHGREIGRLVGDDGVFVHGGTPRQALLESTAAFAEGKRPCLIATTGLFMEGVSIDGIHVLVHAGGLKSRARVLQTVGRGMRRAPGKTSCLYVDFWDEDPAGIFLAHSRERLAILKDEGFFVPRLETRRPEMPPQEPIPRTWWHVPDTQVFLLTDADGAVFARALCHRKEASSRVSCKRCRTQTQCKRGERIQWLADPV